ncbi:MAG TPA: hypothetical protein VFL91_04780 [Thermomicrobiales bacterium]|nr:hypothetical protein [Thermomicrobiales bacterium]
MDQHVPRAITTGLRLREVDVLTAFEDGADTLTDPALLDRASLLGRALFAHNDDLLAEAARRQAAGHSFGGLIYAHPLRVSIGACVADLALIAAAGEPATSGSRSSSSRSEYVGRGAWAVGRTSLRLGPRLCRSNHAPRPTAYTPRPTNSRARAR